MSVKKLLFLATLNIIFNSCRCMDSGPRSWNGWHRPFFGDLRSADDVASLVGGSRRDPTVLEALEGSLVGQKDLERVTVWVDGIGQVSYGEPCDNGGWTTTVLLHKDSTVYSSRRFSDSDTMHDATIFLKLMHQGVLSYGTQ